MTAAELEDALVQEVNDELVAYMAKYGVTDKPEQMARIWHATIHLAALPAVDRNTGKPITNDIKAVIENAVKRLRLNFRLLTALGPTYRPAITGQLERSPTTQGLHVQLMIVFKRTVRASTFLLCDAAWRVGRCAFELLFE